MLTKAQLADRRFFLIFIAGLAALGPMSIDMYLPTLPDMAQGFNADISAANLTVSYFMFGMALGQLFGGPLSDQLGRKTIGLIGLSIFIVATLAIISAGSIQQIQLLRLAQAIGGGFCSVICMAQARDVFPPDQVAKKFANIILVILLAPMIAPSFGALLAPLGWRSVFWVLILYALLVVTVYLLRVPETNPDNAGRVQIKGLFKGYLAAITNRTDGRLIALRFAIFSGFSSGVLFTYVTNASYIFIEYFALSVFHFAATFALLVGMMMVGNRITAYFLDRIPAPLILSRANWAQIGIVVVAVVVSSTGYANLWVTLICMSGIIVCNGMISPAASGHYISLYSQNIGSASSLNASMMFAFGSIIGAIAALLAKGSLTPIFVVMLVSVVCARLVLNSTK